MTDKIYGVIAEFKAEGPLIMESYPMNYDDACKRMKALSADPNVIRVAVFKAAWVIGNQTLIPKESEDL